MSDLKCYVYCRMLDEKRFRAYDLNEGLPAEKLIYCTVLENSSYNRERLQELANMNKEINLCVQLRTDKNKVVFQTI